MIGAEAKISVGAIGVELFLITDIDMSPASSLAIDYEKPDGTTGSFSGASAAQRQDEYGNDRYGVLYVTQTDNIDQDGEWKVWARATNLGSFTGRSPKPFVFRVEP